MRHGVAPPHFLHDKGNTSCRNETVLGSCSLESAATLPVISVRARRRVGLTPHPRPPWPPGGYIMTVLHPPHQACEGSWQALCKSVNQPQAAAAISKQMEEKKQKSHLNKREAKTEGRNGGAEFRGINALRRRISFAGRQRPKCS